VRELLHEITVDELAHVGQRRNFLGPRGVQTAQWLVRPIFRAFFRAIPESPHLFDVEQMIHNALAFNYQDMAPAPLQRSWVPTYCQQPAPSASTHPGRHQVHNA
jgi:hypothetical protein